MPCRDYDYEYEIWLQRGREHLDKMTEMLLQLCQAAKKQLLELPLAVDKWLADPKAGNDVPLSKEVGCSPFFGPPEMGVFYLVDRKSSIVAGALPCKPWSHSLLNSCGVL